jgi:hypothetical protein
MCDWRTRMLASWVFCLGASCDGLWHNGTTVLNGLRHIMMLGSWVFCLGDFATELWHSGTTVLNGLQHIMMRYGIWGQQP